MWVTKENYLAWQKKLAARGIFRWWWQFWSNYSWLFFLIAFGLLSSRTDFWRIVLLAIIAFVAARLIVVTIINAVYKKARPYQKYSFQPITSVMLSLKTALPTSFPSRHVTVLGALAGVIVLFNFQLGIALFGLALLTGIGRVILGYHFPEDVLGGLFLGALAGFVVVFLSRLPLFT